jgi:proprotein convertase subtilisin/kexin type 5
MSFGGICIACSKSCYGCSITPANCAECADGYVLSGTVCQKGCLKDQYFDQNRKVCSTCPTGCSSCTSATNCTSCSNPSITPRGGVCANCPYPCATCDSTGTCNTCLSGHYYFQGVCQQKCPSGSSQRNGICVCDSGVVANGKCVASCSSGFTPINGNCVPCNPNCAQCSGSVNSCTSCVSGFAVDVKTQSCVAATQCNYGQ